MYQNELTPEVDKVNKTINQSASRSNSQTDLQSMAVNSTVTGTQSTESVVMATTHVDDLPHPSEVLIDFKVYTTVFSFDLSFFFFFWGLYCNFYNILWTREQLNFLALNDRLRLVSLRHERKCFAFHLLCTIMSWKIVTKKISFAIWMCKHL